MIEIRMKNKWLEGARRGLTLLFFAGMLIGLTGCDLPWQETESQLPTEVKEEIRYSQASGYRFMTEGALTKVEFTVGELSEEITDLLPAPVTYFEAPGCAGEGIERIYTYSHFVVNTYQKEDKDYVSSIVLMDDMVATEEGLEIGMSLDQVTEIYGVSDRKDGDMLLYSKEGMRLGVIVRNNRVTSIQYLRGDL